MYSSKMTADQPASRMMQINSIVARPAFALDARFSPKTKNGP